MATVLDLAIVSVFDSLQAFSNQDNIWDLLAIPFGENYDRARAGALREQWQTGVDVEMPGIQVVADTVLGVAQGAYSLDTNTIYLRESLVDNGDQGDLVRVLLEEYGHFVDAQVNEVDSPGDEGAIFAAIVVGDVLDSQTLQVLRAEDDRTTITIDGQSIEIEQDDTIATARVVGDLNTLGTQVFDDFLGTSDRQDFYRFNLSEVSNFSVTLGQSSAEIDFVLLADEDQDGTIYTYEDLASSYIVPLNGLLPDF